MCFAMSCRRRIRRSIRYGTHCSLGKVKALDRHKDPDSCAFVARVRSSASTSGSPASRPSSEVRRRPRDDLLICRREGGHVGVYVADVHGGDVDAARRQFLPDCIGHRPLGRLGCRIGAGGRIMQPRQRRQDVQVAPPPFSARMPWGSPERRSGCRSSASRSPPGSVLEGRRSRVLAPVRSPALLITKVTSLCHPGCCRDAAWASVMSSRSASTPGTFDQLWVAGGRVDLRGAPLDKLGCEVLAQSTVCAA